MRLIASQAFETNMRRGEAEERVRTLANRAQMLIAYNDAGGCWDFVNHMWLKFTGRCHPREPDDGWQSMHPRWVCDIEVEVRQPGGSPSSPRSGR
jgi:hypothetical protein